MKVLQSQTNEGLTELDKGRPVGLGKRKSIKQTDESLTDLNKGKTSQS